MIQPRILARATGEEFVGRDAELRRVVDHSAGLSESGVLAILAAPGAGASELLRQAYDRIFARRGPTIPLHFAFNRNDATATHTARRFFRTCLQQYVAYRRVDSSLCTAPVTLNDLADRALPDDYELVASLVESFERQYSSDQDFIDFCFSLPYRLQSLGRAVSPLIDCLPPYADERRLAQQMIASLMRARISFAIASLRRQMSDLLQAAERADSDTTESIHLEELSDDDARRMIDTLARRYEIQTNEPTRDLIIQQLGSNPFFIKHFMQSARDEKIQLASFLDCQRLYVDELMGGRIQRHFAQTIDSIASDAQTKRTLLRVLHESASHDTRKSSLWAWKKRLNVASAEFERIIDALHVCELVNSSAAFVEVNSESQPWLDYLSSQYRSEIEGQPRARIVGETLMTALKRAPQAMARKYRREAAIGVSVLLERFDCQSVPASLFHYDRFAAYRGEDADAIDRGLDSESDLIRLPQMVYVVSCSGFSSAIQADPERCVVGYGFENAEYTDENETSWVVAEIDAKLEATPEVTQEWCDRLATFAREAGFEKPRIWLIAPEGFSERACELLRERNGFASSRQQVELLASRIQQQRGEAKPPQVDEYEMIIPMGEDTELIAANTVEQIARRVNFQPEAINQIKTALVEACINAAEHSLSPDRKIYQRFRIEGDKLVVTVASRGVVPAQVSATNGEPAGAEQNGKSRRGWGLKLIKTLMDEVEFERVDDGTQLKMTKYRR